MGRSRICELRGEVVLRIKNSGPGALHFGYLWASRWKSPVDSGLDGQVGLFDRDSEL